jgi:Protein of unknown function (DUF3577)
MSAHSQESYFDLHITGVGYLNRVREVPARPGSKRHKPFLACLIAALNGPSDDVAKKYIDCTVPAEDAAHLVRRCQDAVEKKRKVLIGFRASDPWIDTFVYKNGDRKGQPGYSWKARLIFISFIKIDGKLEYKAERGEDPSSEPDPTEPSESLPAPSETSEGAPGAQSAPPLAA